MRRKLIIAVTVLAVVASMGLSACGSSGTKAGSSSSATSGSTSGQSGGAIKRGGEVTTMLQNLVFAGVDPAYGAEPLWEADFMEAIFGELFTAEPNGQVGLGMAESAKLSPDAQTFTFTIKKGINFTDGTPYNADAVVYNIKRDLATACFCAPDFKYVKSITATGPYTVQLQMSQPDSVIEKAFVDSVPDWIASPTAIEKLGKTGFGEHPVGAGPFMVSSITPGSKVDLVRNPNYYVKGQPYLDKLEFRTSMVDQSSYAAMQSGTAQILAGIATASIINQAKSQYDVKLMPGPLVSNLELNSFKPPFDNLVARQAVARAIDPTKILAINSPGLGQVVQGPQGPGGAYFPKTVKGYQGYDLNKAKALVKQLGGLSFTLIGVNNSSSETLLTSLQTQLAQAGINAKILTETLPVEMTQLGAGNWQAVTSSSGGLDPDVGTLNLLSRFGSGGQFSCCKDTTLDNMINQTYTVHDGSQRAKLFDQIYQRIAEQAYIVPLYAAPENIITTKNLGAFTPVPCPNGSVCTSIPWATLHYTS